MILKIKNLSKQNRNKYQIFLKKKHKIVDFLGYFEINKFQKITRIRLNFNKLKFYLKHLKVESNSLTVLNEVLNIKK
jgi:hypothetical protein